MSSIPQAALDVLNIGSSLLGGGGPGTYVVLSYLPGHYEQGEYAVFTLIDPSS